MKKQHVYLLFTCLLIVVVMYFILLKWPEIANETSGGESVKVAKDPEVSLEIFKVDKKEITAIDLGDFALVLTDGVWKIKGSESIELDQRIIKSNLVENLAQLNADAVVGSSGDLSLGLDNPHRTITVVLANGERRRFYIGNKTPVGSSNYFAMEGNDNIYTIFSTKAGYFLSTLKDLRDKSLYKQDVSKITSVDIHFADRQMINLKYKAEEEAWYMTYPYSDKCDSALVKSLVIEEIESMHIKEFADDAPVSLEPYGLGSAACIISFSGEDKQTERVVIGGQQGDTYFVKKGTGNSVYSVDAASLGFMNVLPEMLINKGE